MSRQSEKGTTRPRSRTARLSEKERAAKVDALMDQLCDAVAELTDGEQWTAMLRTAAKFHHYSFRNVMLLHAQAAERGLELTAVAGYSTWRTLGRTVRRGERGLAILAPVTRRIDSDEPAEPTAAEAGAKRVLCGVRVVHVFDLSQTDGKPLPDPARPQPLTAGDDIGLWESLATLVEAEGYQLQRNPDDNPERHGWTNHAERIVSVRDDLDGAQAAAVLAHELGHIRADHSNRDISRAQKETEAESIAHIVMTAHGFDATGSAVPYIAGWSNRDPDLIAAAAETVHNAAAGILADLAKADDQPGPQSGSPPVWDRRHVTRCESTHHSPPPRPDRPQAPSR